MSGAGSDQLLSLTIQQLKSLELSTMNIVTFKAAKEGITLTDNVNGCVRVKPLNCGGVGRVNHNYALEGLTAKWSKYC